MTTHIYVDVDGVLNACHRKPWNTNPTWDAGRWQSFYANGYCIRYNEEVIDALRALEAREDVKMHWLTTWTSRAPELLSPTLGIGADWEVVGIDVPQTYGVGTAGYHWWKYNVIGEHIQETGPDKIIWIDDDLQHYRIEDRDNLLKVAPLLEAGLENHHFDAINAFLETPTP